MRDLKRAEQRRPPFKFDGAIACQHCEFIEGLPHVEGNWSNPFIRLEDWQLLFVVQLFGFRARTGYGRRFTDALLAIARKNAKSTLAAAILLSCLCLEREPGAQVISAATTGDQARIVWNIAKKMIDKVPELKRVFELGTFANSIARYDTMSSFKPINAKASTQDGLNPSHQGFDELHAHKTHDLLNVLASAAGARENPLRLYTTTEGYTNAGPWAETSAFAKNVLLGVVDADHFLALYFTLDEEDDDFDETKWIKANPLMTHNKLIGVAMRKMALEARNMPGRLAEFRIKRLNKPSETAKGWINLARWNLCSAPIPFELFERERVPCYGGLDLASTSDMNAFSLVWEYGGKWYVALWYWVPKDCVDQRTERNATRYNGWVEAGHMKQTDGNVTDYNVIYHDIVGLIERFAVQQIAYDDWNSSQLVNNLSAVFYGMVRFRQGHKSFADPMREIEIRYKAGRLAHGGNPVLRWNAANLVPRYDENLNVAPDKRRSPEKIDGFVAMAEACGLLHLNTIKGPSVYEERGIIEVEV